MLAIYKRELQSYFLTPIGYVFMGVFLLISGLMFYVMNLSSRSSEILMFLGQITFVWMLVTPILTMRLLAEERQKKTDQLLLTSPVSQTGIIFGKYFAACTVLVVTVMFINVYMLVIAIYGEVYFFEWLIAMLGFMLQGCAFIALDLYISGLTQSQVTASVFAFGVNLVLWVLDVVADNISLGFVAHIVTFISPFKRYEPFLLGQLSYASILFYVCFIVFFLAASVHHMDMRRVKGV